MQSSMRKQVRNDNSLLSALHCLFSGGNTCSSQCGCASLHCIHMGGSMHSHKCRREHANACQRASGHARRAGMQGLRKPDAQVFATICDHLSLSPSEAVLIDDRQANIDAAEAYGMHGILMTDSASLASRLEDFGFLQEASV